jgi:hypothetical protein
MAGLLLVSFLAFLPAAAMAQSPPAAPPNPPAATGTLVPDSSAEAKVDLIFEGGHETVGADRGRPVILIAAALGVPDDVFRQAFTKVKPAPAGQQPDPAQVILNKQTLMSSLGPYGVTDDRLNIVSNYYRYRRSRGEMWRNTPATAYATIQNGVVTAITITKAGSGYSSPPKVSVSGLPGVHLAASVAYGTKLEENGSIKEIKVVP